MLSAREICKSYGKHVILDQIDLDLAPGECIGIVGANGCGKTTLLSVLAGARKADHGTICLDGKNAYTGRNSQIRSVAYVPQENPLMEELSVHDNLLLWYRGDRKRLEKDLTDGPAAILGITEMLRKTAGQLSGGMKRRVGLIQALLNNPDFLIIDEPTTGLDPEERIRIRNLLVDFSKDRTVLFSTHVVEDLAATCTQLAIMKKGSFLYSGSVSGLLENAKGCVWNCTVQNAEEARLLEANYSISSKQYVENGIHMKVLSKGKPNENCVLDNDITLEDAYIYLTNS